MASPRVDDRERAELVQQRAVDRRVDNMLKISTDGRKAALDMRLVDPEASLLDAATKSGAAADVIADVYEQNKDRVYMDPDTKEDLADRGVPGEKVRFMHEAKNDVEKGRLFAACRSGDVAVLIGSTQKMGVGTNIQDRAVHMVDMDAPWRPADVSQRHGRIIRQGNQNPEVAISQVVTKGSFDAFMWQTLERKSKFIDQIMRGKLDVREIEDVGENTMSFAEVKAISSGNPLILEKSKADQELSRLERLSRAWGKNQFALVHRKEGAESKGKILVENLPKLQAAVARTTGEVGGESFALSVDGRRHDKRTDAAEALGEWMRSNTSFRPPERYERDAGVAAHIAGHDVRVEEGKAILNDIKSSPVRFHIDGAPGVVVETSWERAKNPNVGLITQLENRITGLPKAVAQQEQRIDEARQEYRQATATLKEPFKHEDALKNARWDVERIGRRMSGDEAPQPSFDAEFETIRRLQRANSPLPPLAGSKPTSTPVAQPR